MSYAQALKFVLAREGGKVDDKTDRGGRTAYGITQKTYNAHREALGLEAADVWAITQEEVATIYRDRYWDAVHGDTLQTADPRLALAVMDCAVTSGPGRALKHLQKALTIPDDGVWGPQTEAALHAAGPPYDRVLAVMLGARDVFMRAIVAHDPTQQKYLKGWLNRVNQVRVACGLPEEPHGL